MHRARPQGEPLPCKSQWCSTGRYDVFREQSTCRAWLHLCLMLMTVQLAHVIGDAPQGGQVLIDPLCYSAISNALAEIAKRIPLRPDHDALPESLL